MDKIEILERKIKNLENIIFQQGEQRKSTIEALQTINKFMKDQVNTNEAIAKTLREAFTQINELSIAMSLKNSKKEKRSIYDRKK